MKTLKLRTKKRSLTLATILAMGMAAFCTPVFNKYNVRVVAFAGDRADAGGPISHEALNTDSFFYGFPFSINLGIRFKNNGKIKSDIYEAFRWSSDQPSTSKSFRNIIIDGDCAVELCAAAINEKNAGDYRYRVVKNFNEGLAQWVKPSVFIASGDSKVKYAYLGPFNYVPGQVLKVEIYNVKNNGLQNAMSIMWGKIKPVKVRGFFQFISHGLHSSPGGLVSVEMDALKKTKGKYNTDFIETTSVKDIKFRLGDSLQNLNFFCGDFPRFYNYRVALKREVNGRTDTVFLDETKSLDGTNGDFSLDSFDLNKRYWNNPGKYRLTFAPQVKTISGQAPLPPDYMATSISFTVLPGNSFRRVVSVLTLIEVVLVIISIAAIIFVYYRVRQRALLAEEIQNRETATLQLQSIRSQLNPHFIFNALAGIQNLMNKSAQI